MGTWRAGAGVTIAVSAHGVGIAGAPLNAMLLTGARGVGAAGTLRDAAGSNANAAVGLGVAGC